MGFWGREIKPGRPFTHAQTEQRLHISQATLGGGGDGKVVVQCRVGNEAPVFLCCLVPDASESCQLNLEFQELHDVIFSVTGPRSVHLTGYFLPHPATTCRHHDDDDDDDSMRSFGEDIADSEPHKCYSYTDEDDDYEDSFIDDDDEIEEALEEKKARKRKNGLKRLKKKYECGEAGEIVLDSEDEDLLTNQRQTVTKGRWEEAEKKRKRLSKEAKVEEDDPILLC